MNCTDCPRFDRCSAPLCPLDPHWRERRHIEGEPVCAYLLEAARNNGAPPKALDVPEGMGEAVAEAYPEMFAACGSVRKALKRASTAGPRMGRMPGKQNPGGDAPGLEIEQEPEPEGTDV